MTKMPVVMLGMSRYYSWLRGVTNRQLELLNELRQRNDVGPILFVDINPWRRRDLLKYGVEMRLSRLPIIAGYSKWWRRLFKVDDNFYVLSSVSRLGVGKWQKLAKDIKEAIRLINMSPVLIWSYVPSTADLVTALPHQLLAFDAVDNWLLHPSYKCYALVLKQGYEQWAKIADFIFTVNPSNQSLFSDRHDIIHVPNGVAISRYEVDLPMPLELTNLPRPILGYVGTIQDRLDIDIINRLSADFPKASLVFIGPVWYQSLAGQLKGLPNVHLLGKKPWQEVSAFIKNFNVGLVPHHIDEFLTSTEPMKVYEYLAAGKPVVITTGSEFGELQKFLYSAPTPAEFSQMVTKALTDDNVDLQNQRQLAVVNCDWSRRLDMIMEHIHQHLSTN